MKGAQRVYALDIGTRTVVGVILERDNDAVSIVDAEMWEHKTRAMIDGQIHDVEAVAQAIAAVTSALEERTGEKLTEVAVAAAGRSLRTALGRYEVRRDLLTEITPEESLAMELAAVQEAQKQVSDSGLGPALFCVGYSVIHYYLEEQPIVSLIGQTGSLAAVEVVATFLPRVVVDSLFASLRRCHLEVKSLTLEPIAAHSVAIAENMRLLNLALVDVGAGTSDIALIRKGTTYGYAMVPLGGDEVTEAIVENYLVDFDTAEEIKRNLNHGGEICFTDILGNQLTVKAQEIIDTVLPVIRKQAASIAEEIMELNGKAPDAVIFVGGGSLTPRLLDEVASQLQLPRQRVGIRERKSLSYIKGDHPVLQGPQAITPIGIGYNALHTAGLPFIRIKVNGREFPIWSLSGVSVAEALLAAGISLHNVYGRPGLGLTVEVDGRLKVFKGSMGKPPRIEVNGQPAGLNSPIKDGDVIIFEPGSNGEDAQLKVKDLLEVSTWTVELNGKSVEVPIRVEVNGQAASLEDQVPDRARVVTLKALTVKEVLLETGDINEELFASKVINYKLNGQPMVYRFYPLLLTVNGEVSDENRLIKHGDRIEYKKREFPVIADLFSDDTRSIRITLNGEEIDISSKERVFLGERELSFDTPLADGMELNVRPPGCLVSDLLPLAGIKPLPSGRLILKVNGQKAGFTTEITSGDQVEIIWGL